MIVHRNKISAHLIQDAMSAKSVFSEITDRECMLVGIKSQFQIRGFIHELSTDPFSTDPFIVKPVSGSNLSKIYKKKVTL